MKNNKIKIGLFAIMLFALSFNVFALEFDLEQGTGTGELPSCAENQFLLYTSGSWVCTDYVTGSGLSLSCADGEFISYSESLSDWVCTSAPTGGFDLTCSNGQTTTYNSVSGEWECSNFPTTTTIFDLTCSNNEILKYDSIQGWECASDNYSPNTDDQTLGEVLSSGNVANQDIDLNGYDLLNAGNILTSSNFYDKTEVYNKTETYSDDEIDVLINNIPSYTGGGFVANLYYTQTESDIATYNVVEYNLNSTVFEVPYIVSSAGETLIEKFLFDEEYSGDLIDAGNWVFHNHYKVSNSNGDTNLKYEVFMRETNGSETVLFSYQDEKDLNSLTFSEQVLTTSQPSFYVNNDSRFGVNVYVVRDLVASVTLTLIYGDGDASFLNTPAPFRHNVLRNLNENPEFQHITSSDRNTIDNLGSVYSTLSYVNSELLNYYLKTETYSQSEVDIKFNDYYTQTYLDTQFSTIAGTYLYDKSCADGEYLSFNSSSDSWACVVAPTGGAGFDLTCADGEFTFYNGTSLAWECITAPTGGSSEGVSLGEDWDNSGYTLNISTVGLDVASLSSSKDVSGGVLYTDGSNDYGRVTGSPLGALGSEDFSICGWINSTRDVSSYYQTFLTVGSSTLLYFSRYSNSLYASFGGYTAGFGGLTNNEWTQFCFVRDSTSTWKMYKNGVSSRNVTHSYTFGSDIDDALQFGKRYSANYYMQGQYDEFSFYHRALNSTEVFNQFSYGRGESKYSLVPKDELKAYYSFDDSSSIINEVNSGNIMTLYNGAYVEDVEVKNYLESSDSMKTDDLVFNYNNTQISLEEEVASLREALCGLNSSLGWCS